MKLPLYRLCDMEIEYLSHQSSSSDIVVTIENRSWHRTQCSRPVLDVRFVLVGYSSFWTKAYPELVLLLSLQLFLCSHFHTMYVLQIITMFIAIKICCKFEKPFLTGFITFVPNITINYKESIGTFQQVNVKLWDNYYKNHWFYGKRYSSFVKFFSNSSLILKLKYCELISMQITWTAIFNIRIKKGGTSLK